MAKGYAIHIGLNKIDPNAYQGKSKLLSSCCNDAQSYYEIAARAGFHWNKILLNQEATLPNFYEAFNTVIRDIKEGDILFFSYAGHGNKHYSPSSVEADLHDEALCLYDGELLDDYLGELWYQFPKKSRVLVISDSCFSGSILRSINISDSKSQSTFKRRIKAHIKLLAAAEEGNKAWNSTSHGLFTAALLKVWNQGLFDGDYKGFHQAISKELPERYPPVHWNIGSISTAFNLQKPFQL